MHYLQRALASFALGTESAILNLFDPEGINSQWLTKNRLPHTNCISEDAVRRIMDTGQQWDLVIATVGIDRFYITTSESQLSDFITWLKNHSRLCLVTPHHEVCDPSNLRLGPYRLNPQFTVFNYFSEISTVSEPDHVEPVVALSDHVMFDGLKWNESKDLVSLTRGVDDLVSITDSARRSRTFMHNEGYVIKSQIGCPDYFDPMEVVREGETLLTLPPFVLSTLNLPEVININRGRAVTTTVRQGISGQVLNSSDQVQDKDDKIKLMNQILDLASSYAELGLFHNDFRPWNILLSPQGLQMVDFADLSDIDQDVRDIPQILALVGTVTLLCNLETHGFHLRSGELFDTDLLELLGEYLSLREMSIGSLYDRPWLQITELRDTIDISRVATTFDLLDALLTRSMGWLEP